MFFNTQVTQIFNTIEKIYFTLWYQHIYRNELTRNTLLSGVELTRLSILV